ncbi:translation initiation factor IF-2 [Alkalilimnicola sp. S0819]|uniref:translation initiation factor IF-2 n=1 Tax=Alkalilimnicola sp. S0819 TaxID=2613922 RepID=UPI0012628269|nr:translation initiation factor IF-2 [Alkalilimnicola sp. S0819]KAB7628441.1 translation initiation factor IF-2 [Alkalilimnicola sp. S0819]MPQ15345.1 translation initiation factor IF-2 [Alkalilimnicola sp. S0819]
MAQVTVREFALTVDMPVERMVAQLEAAGVAAREPDAAVSDQDKLKLLEHLRRQNPEAAAAAEDDAAPRQVTLKRKSHSQLKLPAGGAAARGPRQTRTVNVEVRKRRTYVKRSALEAEAEQQDLERLRRTLQAEAAELEQRVADAQAAQRKAEEEAAQRKAEEDQARRAAEQAAAEQAAEPQPTAQAAPEAAAERTPAATEPAAPSPEDKRESQREAQEARREREAEKRVERKAAKPKKGRQEIKVAAGKGGRRGKRPVRAAGGEAARQLQHGFERPTAPVVREVEIPENITVGDLAQRMSVKAAVLIKEMFKQGVMATINQTIDQDTAAILVEEMGHKPKLVQAEEQVLEAELMGGGETQEGERVSRAPVVTIMGHVDHGKTSLLDYIRRTKVAAGEAGGITQHIGAYHVTTERGMITFLDTPGHEAFTAMRARGAQMTDVVVLVVAADDGVMPQTEEAVKHARAAGVPLVIAVNKVDKPDSNPDNVKQELAQHDVIPEDWGGDVQFIHVSAKTGQGVDDLLESILLQSELLELTAVKDCPATGVVLESSLDKGRGPVATVLVQNGVLKTGDVIISGKEFGRVRALIDENGQRVKEAGPSIPVVVLGLSGLPNAGDEMAAVADEKKAREVAGMRQDRHRDTRLAAQKAAKMDELFNHMQDGETTTVNLLVKADVQGSAEALAQTLTNLSNEKVKVKVVSQGVGGINETDVNLAMASNAILIGFNVRADNSARRMVQENGVDLHYYSIIYDAIEELKRAISGMLAPEVREEIIGLAEVRDVFRSSKLGAVAGCLVTEGVVKRHSPIRVLRDNVVIYEGELESLRRFKDDVKEVQSGTECGIGVKNYNDVRPGDQIECYERVEVKQEL